MRKIFLYGPPGSGKTTLGKLLAERLGVGRIDLDEAIAARAGRSIPEIFASDGESAFRALEHAELAAVAKRTDVSVVSLGGGTLLNPESRSLAEACGTVLCIEAREDVLKARIAAAPGTRPLGDRARERAPHYASFPNRITASFDLPGSLVLVGAGIRAIASIVPAPSLTVTDANLETLYAETLPSGTFAIPAGEETKTLDTVQSIWRRLLSANLGRDATLIAFGGGVTGDLSGFAAATWMRGIPWINIPTTLLAMVDSSTGGKTGCDLPEAKNMIGAFHSPRLVLADVSTLSTLPAREWRCGLAEAIKHAVIADPGLAEESVMKPFAPLRTLPDSAPFSPVCPSSSLAGFVARALAVKVAVVREDPFERTGSRARLNLGHTIGHAVEIASGFRIKHGEAVSIGTVEEARLAVRLGHAAHDLPERIANIFAGVGLPVSLPQGITLEALAPILAHDKKNANGRVRYALPFSMGDVRLVTA